MSKYKLTTLSPIHISSGKEFELNFNLLSNDGFIYIYDEFILVEFFIAHKILVPSSLDELKKVIETNNNKIIQSNLHIRKIESKFLDLAKPLLENISTAGNPIITGSSLKGSLRTAILDTIVNREKEASNILKHCKDKRFNEARFKKRFDNDLANIFKYLKVSDTSTPLETKVYKTINVKKEKLHQSSREKRVENISNYVEAIKPNQSFIIDIEDTHEEKIFQKLGTFCNKFYIPFFVDDEKHYASKNGYLKEKVKKQPNNIFLINIGRFSGAERKSLNNLRDIKSSKANNKSETSARTFALENIAEDTIYYENELIPFGWILCEKVK